MFVNGSISYRVRIDIDIDVNWCISNQISRA
jgi:hypothetical protein